MPIDSRAAWGIINITDAYLKTPEKTDDATSISTFSTRHASGLPGLKQIIETAPLNSDPDLQGAGIFAAKRLASILMNVEQYDAAEKIFKILIGETVSDTIIKVKRDTQYNINRNVTINLRTIKARMSRSSNKHKFNVVIYAYLDYVNLLKERNEEGDLEHAEQILDKGIAKFTASSPAAPFNYRDLLPIFRIAKAELNLMMANELEKIAEKEKKLKIAEEQLDKADISKLTQGNSDERAEKADAKKRKLFAQASVEKEKGTDASYKKALDLLGKIVPKGDKDRLEIEVNKAEIYFQLDDYKKALEAVERYRTIIGADLDGKDERDVRVIAIEGNVYKLTGNYEKAIQLFEKIELEKAKDQKNINLAETYFLRGSLDIDPSGTYVGKNDLGKAEQLLGEIKDVKAKKKILLRKEMLKVGILKAQDKLQEALDKASALFPSDKISADYKEYLKAVEQKKNEELFYLDVAELYLKVADIEKVKKYLALMSSKEPDDIVRKQFIEANLAVLERDWAKAIKIYKEIKTTASAYNTTEKHYLAAQGKAYFRAVFELADCYVRLGSYSDAAELYKEVISKYSASALTSLSPKAAEKKYLVLQRDKAIVALQKVALERKKGLAIAIKELDKIIAKYKTSKISTENKLYLEALLLKMEILGKQRDHKALAIVRQEFLKAIKNRREFKGTSGVSLVSAVELDQLEKLERRFNVDKARRLMKQDNYGEPLNLFIQEIKDYSAKTDLKADDLYYYSEVLVLMREVYEKRGEYENRNAMEGLLLQLPTKSAELYKPLAEYILKQKKKELAIPRAWNKLSAGKYGEAAMAFKNIATPVTAATLAAKISAYDAESQLMILDAFSGLGASYIEDHAWGNALQVYDQLLSLSSKNEKVAIYLTEKRSEWLYQKARIFMGQKLYVQAKGVLSQAIDHYDKVLSKREVQEDEFSATQVNVLLEYAELAKLKSDLTLAQEMIDTARGFVTSSAVVYPARQDLLVQKVELQQSYLYITEGRYIEAETLLMDIVRMYSKELYKKSKLSVAPDNGIEQEKLCIDALKALHLVHSVWQNFSKAEKYEKLLFAMEGNFNSINLGIAEYAGVQYAKFLEQKDLLLEMKQITSQKVIDEDTEWNIIFAELLKKTDRSYREDKIVLNNYLEAAEMYLDNGVPELALKYCQEVQKMIDKSPMKKDLERVFLTRIALIKFRAGVAKKDYVYAKLVYALYITNLYDKLGRASFNAAGQAYFLKYTIPWNISMVKTYSSDLLMEERRAIFQMMIAMGDSAVEEARIISLENKTEKQKRLAEAMVIYNTALLLAENIYDVKYTTKPKENIPGKVKHLKDFESMALALRKIAQLYAEQDKPAQAKAIYQTLLGQKYSSADMTSAELAQIMPYLTKAKDIADFIKDEQNKWPIYKKYQIHIELAGIYSNTWKIKEIDGYNRPLQNKDLAVEKLLVLLENDLGLSAGSGKTADERVKAILKGLKDKKPIPRIYLQAVFSIGINLIYDDNAENDKAAELCFKLLREVNGQVDSKLITTSILPNKIPQAIKALYKNDHEVEMIQQIDIAFAEAHSEYQGGNYGNAVDAYDNVLELLKKVPVSTALYVNNYRARAEKRALLGKARAYFMGRNYSRALSTYEKIVGSLKVKDIPAHVASAWASLVPFDPTKEYIKEIEKTSWLELVSIFRLETLNIGVQYADKVTEVKDAILAQPTLTQLEKDKLTLAYAKDQAISGSNLDILEKEITTVIMPRYAEERADTKIGLLNKLIADENAKSSPDTVKITVWQDQIDKLELLKAKMVNPADPWTIDDLIDLIEPIEEEFKAGNFSREFQKIQLFADALYTWGRLIEARNPRKVSGFAPIYEKVILINPEHVGAKEGIR
ncbi:tetratricopeptide repeat protein [Candidatus Margulisiibacteriota bacterium]